MATWKVEPTWKKSVIERNYLTKDGNTVMVETGWRSGSFYVYTDDDNPPNIESGVDIYNCGYESELIETWDGCWEEVDYDDCDDETREWLEEFFDEGNSWLDLEEQGWTQDECEMIIDCDLEITRINDDDSEGESFITGDNDVTPDQSIELKPGAPWPFSTPENTEETKYAEFKCVDCGYTTEDIMDLVENMDEDDKGAYLCPECGRKVDLG